MKRIYTLSLALGMMVIAQAQDFVLTVAEGTSQVKVTLPAGNYIVNEQDITSNGGETTIDLKGATEVSFKKAEGKITSLKAVNQKGITGFSATGSGLTSIDLHGNSISEFAYTPSLSNGVLKTLLLNDNKLSSISFSGGRWNALQVLDISDNEITKAVSLSALSALQQFYCSNNQITGISSSACANLKTLWCDNNLINQLTLTSNAKIESLVADNNVMTKILTPKDGMPALVDLWINENNLETATVNGCTALYTLNVANNELTSITLAAPSKKMLFADFTGNSLSFSSLYSTSDIINYLYGSQKKFSFAKEVYVHGEEINMPEMGSNNLSGSKLSLSTKWFNWEDDAALKQSSKTSSTGDYTALTTNKTYAFKSNFRGLAYATISTSAMPDLVMRSNPIRVMSEEEYQGVDDLKAAGFTFNVMSGALQMSSQDPIKVRVADINGRLVWSGTVNDRGVQVDGLNGTYIINGIKVVI